MNRLYVRIQGKEEPLSVRFNGRDEPIEITHDPNS